MVYLRQKQVKGKKYYYLVHSYRDGKKHKKIEKYVGLTKPSKSKFAQLKENMLHDLKQSTWICLTQIEFQAIENIKKTKHDILDDEKLMDFCINFTYNTNAIEGSELTKNDIHKLIKHDKGTSKSFKDQLESFTHKKVFMEMVRTKKPLSLQLIKKWHKDIFNQSKPGIAGKYRQKNVAVAGFKAPHYMDIPFLLRDFIKWYKNNRTKLHPIELAALVHLKFVKIHPFMDGNGRIGRLLINYVLNKNKYPMMTVEHKKRINYYKALDKFDATQEEEIFIEYIIKAYIQECS